MGFIEGDGMFSAHVDHDSLKVRLGLSINQTVAEEKLMDAITMFLKNLAQDKEILPKKIGSNVNIYKKINEPNKPSEQPSVRITISDTVYLYTRIIPLFNSLNFHTKKMLDYRD